jgi:chemotaxis protein CheD
VEAPPPRALEGHGQIKRYFDLLTQKWTAQIIAGQIYVCDSDEDISTVLGSCVAVCMRDPIAGVGGMNHFLLPGSDDFRHEGELRYGDVATRRLMSELIKYGARRERLEVSLFGGGRVIRAQLDIGVSNIDFIRSFVVREQLPVREHHLGGPFSRRVRYHPRTGVASVVTLGA